MESNWATPFHFLKLAVKLKVKLLNIFVMASFKLVYTTLNYSGVSKSFIGFIFLRFFLSIAS